MSDIGSTIPVSVGNDEHVRDDYPPDPFMEYWDIEDMNAKHTEYQRLLDDADRQETANLEAASMMTQDQLDYLANYQRPFFGSDDSVGMEPDLRTIEPPMGGYPTLEEAE